jgi:hypothetical protein
MDISKTKPIRPRKEQSDSKIIGFRLPLDLAREVKMEASQRGMKLNDLFAELWAQHKNQLKRQSNS